MKKGFTLVELLVVVAILGILAAVGIVSFGGFLGSSKENAVKSNFNSVTKYVETELMKCDLGMETEAYTKYQQDSSTYYNLGVGDCTKSFEKITFGILQYIHQYDEKGFDNPFKPNDIDLPTGINNVNNCHVTDDWYWGRINCYYKESDDQVFCCSRWGADEEDKITKIIENPY